MRYTHNISDEAIVTLIKWYCNKNPYSISIQETATMLSENILGRTHYHWIEFIKELAECDYFSIKDGKIYT